jgi:hypothetical protein
MRNMISGAILVEHQHTIGLCKCAECRAINPWRSCFTYRIGNYINPGMTGRCRRCGTQTMQTVIQFTETLEDAEKLAEEANETRTAPIT